MADNCEFNEYNMYNVPAISFIGGSRQEYVFYFYEADLITPVSIIGATSILFKIVPYGYSNSVVAEAEGTVVSEYPYNAISVILEDSLTENLFGKYAYQITLVSYNNGNYVPVQGILNISRQFKETE